MNLFKAKEVLYNTQHEPEIAEAIETVLDMADRFQRALALASRIIYEENDCPFTWVQVSWRECGRQNCGHNGSECWQRYFRERARTEKICRICGYTEDSTGLKCTWNEDDLCNRCAEK